MHGPLHALFHGRIQDHPRPALVDGQETSLAQAGGAERGGQMEDDVHALGGAAGERGVPDVALDEFKPGAVRTAAADVEGPDRPSAFQ